MFKKENELVDYIYDFLSSSLNTQEQNIFINKEGKLKYTLPNNKELTHKSDILISNISKNKLISIEVKYKSNVTDAFKARSYDIHNMKNNYREQLFCIIIFVKPKGKNTGLSIEKARDICYPFDLFFGINEEELIGNNEFKILAEKIFDYISV